MATKRKSGSSIEVSTKVIKSGDEQRLPVTTHGTIEQQRIAATALVSPDATRFVPRQVRIKNDHIGS
jgi:hypothetical protein